MQGNVNWEDSSDHKQYTIGEGQHQLQKVEEEWNLGVTINARLTFGSHVAFEVNKGNCIGLIKTTFHCMDKESFLLCKILVRRHRGYANQFWVPRHMKHIMKVKNLQRRATRCTSGFKDLSHEERLPQIKLPSLHVAYSVDE